MPSIPKAELWIRGGPEDGRSINLPEGSTSMGRAITNDVAVEVTGVSRNHARIRADATGYWIEDLGSRNGTFVNGTQVEGEGQRLRNMDRIEFGGLRGPALGVQGSGVHSSDNETFWKVAT